MKQEKVLLVAADGTRVLLSERQLKDLPMEYPDGSIHVRGLRALREFVNHLREDGAEE